MTLNTISNNVIVMQSDPNAMAATLHYLNTMSVDPLSFERRFGRVTREAPWGETLWHGMRSLLQEYRRLGGRGSPANYSGPFLPGWFTAPEPFGKQGAKRSQRDFGSGAQYPAVFAMQAFDQAQQLVPMWCQNILINQSPVWWVHISRVRFTESGVEFLNYYLQVGSN